ncbi:hypothetical protein [Microbacterium xanthum]|uniref:hypothetical protein n=1 Tax=Microbacterium xanthum TaxID=3079794 RepID=UPI002AD1E299|nr:hypothetical protein [Microbacterium sp. KSW-48]MDZ8172075.1 hypothetical protein [Microbacterium sp. KSW-48]
MSRRIVALVIAVGTAALLGAALLWWTLAAAPSGSTATSAAEDYLAALERGDLAAVEALRADALPAQTAAAFAGAITIREARVEVTGERQDDEVAVEASAFFGDERRDFRFSVTEGDDGQWLVSGDLGEIVPTTSPGAAIAVGDAVVASGTALPVLPARYRLTPLPVELLQGEEQVAVGPRETVEVSVGSRLADGAVDVVQDALDAHADACTRTAAITPEGCGFDVPWPADFSDVDSIAYRIDTYPSVSEVTPDGLTVASEGILVATVRGTLRGGGGTGERTYRTADWTLRGTLSFEGPVAVVRAF